MQPDDMEDVKTRSKMIRDLITQSAIPDAIEHQITEAYLELSRELEQPELAVAVRSSATAEDLPGASFAGQQDTYLNIRGVPSVLEHSRLCWARFGHIRQSPIVMSRGSSTTRCYFVSRCRP